jgi:hypothetical protein
MMRNDEVQIPGKLFAKSLPRYTHPIFNPPYRKLKNLPAIRTIDWYFAVQA